MSEPTTPPQRLPLTEEEEKWIRLCAEPGTTGLDSRHGLRLLEALDAERAKVAKMSKMLRALLEMPAACTTDKEVLENVTRREAAKAALSPDVRDALTPPEAPRRD
jgi:hypothetical protein